jgi:hypothetical protein
MYSTLLSKKIKCLWEEQIKFDKNDLFQQKNANNY